jgi:hypothetical protein
MASLAERAWMQRAGAPWSIAGERARSAIDRERSAVDLRDRDDRVHPTGEVRRSPR